MTPQQLKKARHDLGLSVAQMADALSNPKGNQVNPRTVRRWEGGTQDVPGPVVVAVTMMLERAGITAEPKPRLK